MNISICPECKVPEPVKQGQIWLNNGDIVQAVNPRARLGFIECENLDPLFRNVGEIIGMSIENLVVNIDARAVERFMSQLIPESMKEMVQARQMDPRLFLDNIMTYCHIIGFGRYEYIDSRYMRNDDDFSITRVEAPFSVPEAAGGIAGVASALVGGEHAVTYEKISQDLYEFKTRWTEYPEILKEKLRIRPYHHRDGDIELERCATCGVPAALSGFRWYLDRGLIVNKHNGRRMAILGPEHLDVLFRALEEELGETIPDVVVEAQRRFTRTGFYSIEEVSNEGDFRAQLALRGMGNLREISMGVSGMRIRIDNAAGHLLIVGMAQGLFEMALDVGSNVEWELTEDGNLEVEVRPEAIMEMVR
jgi:hypothetical protein